MCVDYLVRDYEREGKMSRNEQTRPGRIREDTLALIYKHGITSFYFSVAQFMMAGYFETTIMVK